MAKGSLSYGVPSLVYDSKAVLADMPVEDLERLNLEFMQVKAQVRRWQQRINAELSRKIERETALRKLNEMTPDAREHLRQLVAAEGIPSREAVNG